MGGKTKQSQRTKNNVRPSSSGRSVELLSNVTTDFSLLKLNGQTTLFPTLTKINLDQGLSQEFQLCIKKLNKKDPITKTKALQELCELVNTSEVEDVVAALPCWTHFYKTLTVDVERKVRESTQACHSAVVSVCGRRVAPHLKQLLPSWLQALHDEHALAQTLALNSLKKTFPERKLPEVLSFCKTEVMSHLLNCLNGNVDSVLTIKIDSVEEKEFQHYRLITSTLRGLEYFIQNLPTTHDEWLWTELNILLQNNAFWKIPSYNNEHARTAWYSTTGQLIERFKTVYTDKYGGKTIKILVSGANETNSVVAYSLWTCLLQLMYSVQDWHKYLEKKELLVKRILEVLRNGGWGDARHLSNVLLPLLAHLPSNVFNKDFYQSFFNAMYQGLQKKNIWSSKSERQAWITSIAECLRYLSIQQYEFTVELVTSVHRTWIQEILSTKYDSQTTGNLVKCSATNMATLVKYWLKQTQEENSEKYEQLIRNFWQNIGSTASMQIDKLSQEEILLLVEHYVLLFKTLKTSFVQDVKKQQSIKFESDPRDVEATPSKQTQQYDAAICERFNHNLRDSVHNICSKYFEFANDKQVCDIMTPLLSLLVEFEDEKLFLCLAQQFQLDSLYKLYDNVFKVWLLSDTMKCKSLVHVTFLILNYITEEEQNSMLDSFQQFPHDVVEWCLSASVSHPHRDRATVRAWTRTHAVRDALVRACRQLARTGSAQYRNLLLLCMNHDQHGDILVGEETASVVMQTICHTLEDMDSVMLEQCASLGGMLATTVHNVDNTKLLMQLFKINCYIKRGDRRLSSDTWCEVRDSWQDALASLQHQHRNNFLLDIINLIHGYIFDNSTNMDISNIENLASICPYLLSNDYKPPEDIHLASTFTQKLFNVEADSMEPFALHYDCIFSNFNCPFEDYKYLNDIINGNQENVMNKENVEKYLVMVMFKSVYMKTVLLHKGDDEDDDMWCDILLTDEDILQELCKVMSDYAIVCSLDEGFAFWPHYQIINKYKKKLDTVIMDIATDISPSSKNLVLKKLSELSLSVGYYWSYARKYFLKFSNTEAGEEQTLDISTPLEAVTGNGFFHTLQANIKDSCDDEVIHRGKFTIMMRSFYIAYGDQLDQDTVRDLCNTHTHCDITTIINAYYKHNNTMLYETDVSMSPWQQVVSNVSVIEFLIHLVQYKGWEMAAHCWDFTTITLCSIMTSIEKSKHNWDSIKVSMLCNAVCNLLISVSSFISTVHVESTRRQPSEHVVHLPTEWKEIFGPDLNTNLFSIMMRILLESDVSNMSNNRAAVLNSLIQCAPHMQWNMLPNVLRVDKYSVYAVLEACAHCMRRSKHIAYHYLTHSVLCIIKEPLISEEINKISLWSEEGNETSDERRGRVGRPRLFIEYLDEMYTQLQDDALAALDNAHGHASESESDTCTMTSCHAWLLAADALHTLCSRAHGDLQQQLLQVYRERGRLDPLLSGSLRLLPGKLAQHALDSTAPAPMCYEQYFFNTCNYSVYKVADMELLSRLSCRCIWWCVCCGDSVSIRGWLSSVSATATIAQHHSMLVYLVRNYISPHLIKQQLTQLQRSIDKLPNDAQVRVRRSCGEVTCELDIEDRIVEIQISFAKDHPVGIPEVRTTTKTSTALSLNTNWIVLYLAYQNGTLLRALEMWIESVTSRIENSNQCYICYCRLEPSTGRLPKALCHKCKNKFHDTCLNKWFSTSKKNTCPLCRTNIETHYKY